MQLLQITAAGGSTDEKTHCSVTIFQQASEESDLILEVKVQNTYTCALKQNFCIFHYLKYVTSVGTNKAKLRKNNTTHKCHLHCQKESLTCRSHPLNSLCEQGLHPKFKLPIATSPHISNSISGTTCMNIIV